MNLGKLIAMSFILPSAIEIGFLAFKNRVLRMILGPMWDLVIGQPQIRSNQKTLLSPCFKRLQCARYVVRAPKDRGIDKGPIRSGIGVSAAGQVQNKMC